MRLLRCTNLILIFLVAAVSAAQTPVPATVEIPAGSFQMGSADGATWEKPVHGVEISAFSIGTRPVSNREFRMFRPAHHSVANDNDTAPVTDVSWEDAVEYCRWLSARTGRSYRLPSEAEWERAARGGLEQKKYPWGDEAPSVLTAPTADGQRAEVRPNPFGVIAGSYNLWEWTADRYSPSYYENSPPKDPPGPDEGEYRVVRGGGFRHDPVSMRCANRGSARPATASEVITFRVAGGGAPSPAPAAISEARPPAPPTPVPEPAASAEPVVATASAAASPAAIEQARSEPESSSEEGGVARLGDIRVESTGESLKVLLATGAATGHSTMVLANPFRLVVDLRGTVMGSGGMSSRDVGQAGVSRIRWAQFRRDPPITRVVFDLSGKPEYSVETTAEGPVVTVQAAP